MQQANLYVNHTRSYLHFFFNSHHTMRLIALLTTTALTPSMPVFADDYVVDVDATTQNAGVILADGDTMEVTETGTITTGGFDGSTIFFSSSDNVTTTNNGTLTTSGNDGAGIEARDSDNFVITNTSMIKTTGNSSEGVYVIDGAYTVSTDGYNLITNTGTISTEGSSGTGILVTNTDRVKIDNSGTIDTLGASSIGISTNFTTNALVFNSGGINTAGSNAYGFQNNTSSGTVFENTGRITTSGNNAYGLYNRNSPDVVLTNNGIISTSGSQGYGIQNQSSDGATISNNGTLQTTGATAIGVFILNSDNTSFSNSGILHTTGAGAYGLIGSGGSDTEYTNSGYLVSEQSYSIALFDTNAVLNLRDPSYLGGAMLLNSGTEVNITTGPSHSVFWNFGTTPLAAGTLNVSGDVPWFFDASTNTFATYDPTGPAALINASADAASMLSRMGRNMLGTSGFWGTAYGGQTSHDGDNAMLAHDIKQSGIAVGYANTSNENVDWNVMIGSLKSDIKADSAYVRSYDIEGEGWFLGAESRFNAHRFDIEAGIVASFIGHDSSRFVNDNLALTNGRTLGIGGAAAEYDSVFVAPELGLHYLIGNTGSWDVSPAGRLRYVAQWSDGYTESGSGGANVEDSFLGLWELDVEMNAARELGNWFISSTLGYTFRETSGNSNDISMLNMRKSVSTDISSGKVYADLNFKYAISEAASLQLGITGLAGNGDIDGAARMTFQMNL